VAGALATNPLFEFDGCLVRGEARADGKDTANAAERSALRPEVAEANQQQIQDAVTGCPTECIKQDG
jgi:ferredoxin